MICHPLSPDFSLSKHVQNVCKSCFVQLCAFRHVRQFLTHDSSVLVANALVSSRLDYCNSLFRSLSKCNLCKLQCIQNSAARIVSNTSRYISITPVLKKLDWLHAEHHSVFKTVSGHWFSPSILLQLSLPTAVLIVPDAVTVVVISLPFTSSTPLSINLSVSLLIVLLFEMLFLKRLVHPAP